MKPTESRTTLAAGLWQINCKEYAEPPSFPARRGSDCEVVEKSVFKLSMILESASMATDLAKNHADKVYVVDDDVDVGHSIAVTLSSVGYAVERFASAAEFLEHASASGPCVAIVDMMLPGMTGLNLCREINLRRMPCSFLVISGHADVPSSVEAMRMGAIDLLEKPFSRQRMLEIVNKAVRVAQLNYERRLEEEEATRQLSA